MTVSTTTNVVVYTGPQSATLPVPFRFSQNADLVVETVVVATGAITKLVLGSDYTAQGAGLPTGGTITLTAGSLPSGETVTIARDPAEVQDTSLPNGSPYFGSTIEGALDLLTMEVQALRTLVNNSLKIPLVESLSGLTTTFPTASQRAGLGVLFDNSGNVTVGGVNPGNLPIAGITQVIDTIAALKALPLPTASVTYLVRGYNTIGDNGGGMFRWNSSDTRADDMGTILALTIGGTGRFNRDMIGGHLSSTMFGAFGNGQSHPITSGQAASANAAYAIGAAVGDEADWMACQLALAVVGQTSIPAASASNAYRYGNIVEMLQGVFVHNKTIQLSFGVTLRGSGRTAFEIDVSGLYPTGTIINYTGISAAAAINITGFVAATGLPVAYNVTVQGSDIDNGTYTSCESARLMDLTVYTAVSNVTYGINIAGAPTSSIINVMSNGFQTGFRAQACWGSRFDIQVIATLVGCLLESDINACTFDLYLNCTSSATAGSICMDTDFIRACTFRSLTCEHAQYGIHGVEFIACTVTSAYFEDLSIGCVNAVSTLGVTFGSIYFNCAGAYGFNMQNFSSIFATMALIEGGGSPNLSAVVNASASGSSLTLFGFTPTAAERTKDFGSGGMINYINSPDGAGKIVNWTMAEGRTINISFPDSSSQLVEQYQINQVANWDAIYGPGYFRIQDLIHSQYAFQFNFTTSSPAMLVIGSQVLTIRQTGWTGPTGSLSRAQLNTGTATTSEIAQCLGALLTDLLTHGLIGA